MWLQLPWYTCSSQVHVNFWLQLYVYSAVKKYLLSYRFWHTYSLMFQIIRQTLIEDTDNLGKYKKQFLNDDVIY